MNFDLKQKQLALPHIHIVAGALGNEAVNPS